MSGWCNHWNSNLVVVVCIAQVRQLQRGREHGEVGALCGGQTSLAGEAHYWSLRKNYRTQVRAECVCAYYECSPTHVVRLSTWQTWSSRVGKMLLSSALTGFAALHTRTIIRADETVIQYVFNIIYHVSDATRLSRWPFWPCTSTYTFSTPETHILPCNSE